ncbi:MAG TPA: hypothetical protein GXX38_02120 [Clostridia bacterium]|nr:hypothetical protein [Clostridia bacterium]
MSEKDWMELFDKELDKIIAGEPIIPSEYDSFNEKCKELLVLARLLAKVDYTTENRAGMGRIWSRIRLNEELEDDALDLVAGGLNLNEVIDEKEKKKVPKLPRGC